jgi:hypothetical protein
MTEASERDEAPTRTATGEASRAEIGAASTVIVATRVAAL